MAKKKVNTKLLHKREQAMLDLSAPRLIPQKQLIIPLTKITLNSKLKPITKLIYGELYTLFNVSPKIQLNHIALEKPVTAKRSNLTLALRYFKKLHLIRVVSVRNTTHNNHVIGHIIINTGLNKNSEDLDALLEETDYQRNIKKHQLEHIGKLALRYLNQKVGHHWNFASKVNHYPIMRTLREGYTLQDFKKVVDNMYTLWHNDPKMSQYLEPPTLFGNKFDKYLNIIVNRQPINQKQINRKLNQGGSLNKYDW